MTGHTQREVRCGNCRRLLAKGEAIDLTIKCPRCGTLNHVRGTTPDTEGPRASIKEARNVQTFPSSPGT